MRAVTEIKHRLNGETVTYPSMLLDGGDGFAVVRYVVPRAGRVADLTLPAGTVTIAYYWEDRPYNLYHWLDSEGATIAFYLNLSRDTRISDGAIEWHDLAVDVLVTPDGRVRMLDEDELPPGLAPEARAAVDRAREAAARDLPDLLDAVEAASRRHLAGMP